MVDYTASTTKGKDGEMFFKTEKERLARRFRLVPEEGLEPSRTCVRQILSLLQVACLLGIKKIWDKLG